MSSVDEVSGGLEQMNVNESSEGMDVKKNEEGIPYFQINGEWHPPLADGKYDAIVLSTGLEECILAGLLAIRGKKVLQIDRNSYYGGSCASLNLKELYEKGKPGVAIDMNSIEQKFGASREYCVDLVPKLLMANGKLVKMLIQTGVTKYMDFNGIHGSYVYNTGSIYKLPVTPTEALTSSLVKMFQKPKLRSFADFVAKFRLPRKVANTFSFDDFVKNILDYYRIFNSAKAVQSEITALCEKFEPNNREDLCSALEEKYLFPVFPFTKVVTFHDGPLGMIIEGITLSAILVDDPSGNNTYNVKSFIRVKEFVKTKEKQPGQAEASRQVRVNDIISKINGKNVLGLGEDEVKKLIVGEKRPYDITFITPGRDLFEVMKYGTKVFKQKREGRSSELNLKKMTAKELMDYYGLDNDTQNFLGHGMALRTTDSYLDETAEDFVAACQLYAHSIGRYGQDSPYLYPLYGLASLPEGFSRLAAIYGGTVMLRTNVEEILHNSEGKAVGVKAEGMAATADIIIGDASFFPANKVEKTGQVVRSICILKSKLKGVASGDSAQIIIPAKHISNKKNDVYVSMLSHTHQVSSKGIYLAIASTTVETTDPVSELDVAFKLMGDVEERFDFVSDSFKPKLDEVTDNCYITTSLDATSHFETAAQDIMRIYKDIFGVELDLDQKIVQTD